MIYKSKIVPIILFSIILIPQIALASWWNPFTWKIFNHTEEKIEKSNRKELYDNLLKQYNATPNWEDDISYTIQLQKKIIEDKPIIFIGRIDDIFIKDNKFFIKMDVNKNTSSFEIEIECNKDTVEELLKNNKLDSYVVVSTITNISKALFNVDGYSISENIESPEDQIIELGNFSSDVYLMNGKCVDILKIEKIK